MLINKISAFFILNGTIFVKIIYLINCCLSYIIKKTKHMNSRKLLTFLILLLIALQSCQPLTSIQIETIVPAKIDFPGNFNKIVFLDLATDINHDGEVDTLLYNMITEEMSLGFIDAIQNTAGIDSSRFFYVKGIPQKEQLYYSDTLSWAYLEKISGSSNADIFIVLDSVFMSVESELLTDYYYTPAEYYRYRELSVGLYWSVFDLVEKKRLDQYHYNDTLYWDARGYFKVEVENKMPSIERSVRETSYFAATDYASRIFPGWKTEYRAYFHAGNKDFEQAAEYANNNDWIKASEIWKKYG